MRTGHWNRATSHSATTPTWPGVGCVGGLDIVVCQDRPLSSLGDCGSGIRMYIEDPAQWLLTDYVNEFSVFVKLVDLQALFNSWTIALCTVLGFEVSFILLRS